VIRDWTERALVWAGEKCLWVSETLISTARRMVTDDLRSRKRQRSDGNGND